MTVGTAAAVRHTASLRAIYVDIRKFEKIFLYALYQAIERSNNMIAAWTTCYFVLKHFETTVARAALRLALWVTAQLDYHPVLFLAAPRISIAPRSRDASRSPIEQAGLDS